MQTIILQETKNILRVFDLDVYYTKTKMNKLKLKKQDQNQLYN